MSIWEGSVIRSRGVRSIVAGVVCAGVVAGGWWLWSATETVATGYGSGGERKSPRQERTVRLEVPRDFRLQTGETLAVAMDEVCVIAGDGVEEILRLEPPATPSTYRARLAAMAARGEVLPVVYAEDAVRDEISRRVVTRGLRVRVDQEMAAELAGRHGLELAERPEYAREWVILEAVDPLAALAVVDGVRNAEGVAEADVLLGRKRFRRAMPNDPMISSQWHLKNPTVSPSVTHANVETAWSYPAVGAGVRGRGIRIGIVDDGVQTAHPDLVANVDAANGWDWNGNDADPNPALGGANGDHHGTAVAGVAAAVGNNGLGVSGVAPEAGIVGMRLISSSPTDSQEAGAFNWKNDIIQVKNNSWGPYDSGDNLEAPEPLARAAFRNAVEIGRGGKGTIFVWAGGNGASVQDNSNYDGYANSIYTIAVGASSSTGGKASYSEPGANLLIVAPSGSAGASFITTTDRTSNAGYNTSSGSNGDYYSSFSGTSSATPVVSGVVALMLEKNPGLGWRDVQEILVRSATRIAPGDSDWVANGAGYFFNHKFGAGLVNATAAVNLADGWENLLPHESVFTSDPAVVAIPDMSPAGVSKTFDFVEAGFRVEHVTVTLSATHARRGDLDIVLTSPSGMVSRLAEMRTTDMKANYTGWTFSSVRHWGEEATGEWKVTVSDVRSGSLGSLGAVTLTLYGARGNPLPSVAITSPADGSAFSPGVSIPVAVEAEDLAMGAVEGEIDRVELFVNGISAGIDTEAPYQFTISPPEGSYTLMAQATDHEGAVGTSNVVNITVANLPPVVEAVSLSLSGQVFEDEEISVTGVTANDPEGAAVTLSYQWKSSVDGREYAVAAGVTSAVLPVSPANVGRLWVCEVRAFDGNSWGVPFVTEPVNVLARPPLVARRGGELSYDSGLVLMGKLETVDRRVIINEISNGAATGGSNKWVELLVLQAGSLVNWELKASSGGSIRFANHPLWQNVPAGTLIVVYNGNARDGTLPADIFDASDGQVVVAGQNTTYFSPSGWLFFSVNNGWISVGDGAVESHRISYGSDSSGVPALGGIGNLQAARFSEGGDEDADLAASWSIISAAAGSVTPGDPNTPANTTFVTKLRMNRLAEVPPYRLGAGTNLPVGLTLDAVSGTLSGTVSSAENVPGDYPVVIERFNELGETVSLAFDLKVVAANYADWISRFAVEKDEAPMDHDGDGIPNLVEYLLDLNPAEMEAVPPIGFSADEGAIALTYRESKLSWDAVLEPEWAVDLGEGVVWETTGITKTILEEDVFSRLIRASLPVNGEDGKRFLRLRATLSAE